MPSAYRFLERFKKLSTSNVKDDQLFFLAQYIQEITLLDASLLKYKPSELAASGLILAARLLNNQSKIWNSEMEKETGISYKQLQPVVADVQGFVSEINPKFLATL